MMKYLQKLGKALMLPVAVLPICGLLMGIGYALCPATMQGGDIKGVIPLIGLFLVKAGAALIDNMALLFVIGVGVGLSKDNDGTGGVAALASWLMITTLLNTGFVTTIMPAIAENANKTLAFDKIVNPFIGILAGIIGSTCYNKFKDTKLPDWLSFFSGKRCVAIVAGVVSILVSVVLLFVWPLVFGALIALGEGIVKLGGVGAGLYAFFNRLLIPTGLHHVLNGIFRTTAIGGVYQGVEGCLNIFLQFFDSVDISVMREYTQFLGQGKMLFMIFGLPAAAYAIYKTSPGEKKNKVKALMIAGVAASIVSGITEPLEFAFMFIAPPLFLFHAVMGGISFMLMSLLQVAVGNTGGGIIDMFIWGVFQPGSNWYWIIIIGPIYAIIYYNVFKWYFNRKHLSIEVAEDDGDKDTNDTASISDKQQALATKIIEGLGGFDNIITVNNCISRLRVDVKDMSLVNEEELKKTGSMGIVKPSETHIQVIYGPKVEQVANSVREVLKY